MRKYLFIAGIILLSFALTVQSPAEEETIAISTYYPSPYGVYNQLEAKKSLIVGDISGSGINPSTLLPGQTVIGNSVILNPLQQDPPSGKPGQLIYNGPDSMMRYWNGAKWVNLTTTYLPGVGQLKFILPGESCPAGFSLLAYHFPPRSCSYQYTTFWHPDCAPDCHCPLGGTDCFPYTWGSSCSTAEQWSASGPTCNYLQPTCVDIGKLDAECRGSTQICQATVWDKGICVKP